MTDDLRRVIRFEDADQAAIFGRAADELAFELSSLAVREGTVAAARRFEEILNQLSGGTVNSDVALLALTVQRLLVRVRTLRTATTATGDPHPGITALHEHATLLDAEAHDAVAELERLLQAGAL